MVRTPANLSSAENAQVLRKFKAGVFQALAHPVRVHIVELLAKSEMSVSELLIALGVEQANASQHLAVLRAKHLVASRKEGNQVLYSLRDDTLAEVLVSLRKFFQSHLQEFLLLLKTVD